MTGVGCTKPKRRSGVSRAENNNEEVRGREKLQMTGRRRTSATQTAGTGMVWIITARRPSQMVIKKRLDGYDDDEGSWLQIWRQTQAARAGRGWRGWTDSSASQQSSAIRPHAAPAGINCDNNERVGSVYVGSTGPLLRDHCFTHPQTAPPKLCSDASFHSPWILR